MIESWGDLIDKLGGTTAVSAHFGLTSNSIVSGWRKRGVPSARWIGICRLAKANGVTVTMERLAELDAADARQAEARV